MHLTRLLTAFAFTATLASPAGAQLDSATAQRLITARRVRLEFFDNSRIEGQVDQVRTADLAIRAIMRPTIHRSYFVDSLVPIDAIRRAWAQNGTHWRTGALIGGGALGLLGVAIGLQFQGDLDTPGCSGATCVVGLGVGSGIVGALAGGLLGAVFMRWEQAWPPRS